MDKDYEAAVVEWDISNWSRAIDYFETKADNYIASFTDHPPLALDIGARNGGLSLYWAKKGASVVCSDVTDSGFEKARELHKKYGVAHQIVYEKIDALHIPYKDKFDIITFKSVLGGVASNLNGYENARKMMQEIHRALKPGGTLFFVENLAGTRFHMFCREHFRRYGKRWHYFTISEIKENLNCFASFDYKVFGFMGAFSKGKSGLVFGNIDRYIDSFLPEECHYIISVICKKSEVDPD